MLQGGLNITGRQIRIFRNDLIDRIARLFKVAYCTRRYPCTSNHRRIVAHIPRLLDPPDLIFRAVPQPFRVSFVSAIILLSGIPRTYCPLTASCRRRPPGSWKITRRFKTYRVVLVQRSSSRWLNLSATRRRCWSGTLCCRRKQPQGAERYDIFERIDPAISRIAAFLGVARREKPGPIPITQLRWGEASQAFNVFLGERKNDVI